ncbi:hypothetical protein IP84_16115 [beta proteobacterium AAP99]|nr:hypothetical protein IP84_16115 [beta proteobacterium AAP99]
MVVTVCVLCAVGAPASAQTTPEGQLRAVEAQLRAILQGLTEAASAPNTSEEQRRAIEAQMRALRERIEAAGMRTSDTADGKGAAAPAIDARPDPNDPFAPLPPNSSLAAEGRAALRRSTLVNFDALPLHVAGERCKTPTGLPLSAVARNKRKDSSAPEMYYHGDHVECRPVGEGVIEWRYPDGKRERWVGAVTELIEMTPGFLSVNLEGQGRAIPNGRGWWLRGAYDLMWALDVQFRPPTSVDPRKGETVGVLLIGRPRAVAGLLDRSRSGTVPSVFVLESRTSGPWPLRFPAQWEGGRISAQLLQDSMWRVAEPGRMHALIPGTDSRVAMDGEFKIAQYKGDDWLSWLKGNPAPNQVLYFASDGVQTAAQFDLQRPGGTAEDMAGKRVLVTLPKPRAGLPAGRYAIDAPPGTSWAALDELLRNPLLLPVDGATLAAAPPVPPECASLLKAVPSGWVPWGPSCQMEPGGDGAAFRSMRVLQAGNSQILFLGLTSDGQVAAGLLRVPSYPEPPSERMEQWSASLGLLGTKLVLVGRGQYVTPSFMWQGEFQDMLPHGEGQCTNPDAGGNPRILEPCTMVRGERIDEVHRIRVARAETLRRIQAAEERAARAREQEQARIARAQRERDALEEEMEERRRRREQAEEDAAGRQAIVNAIRGVGQSFAQANADMQRQRQANQAIMDSYQQDVARRRAAEEQTRREAEERRRREQLAQSAPATSSSVSTLRNQQADQDRALQAAQQRALDEQRRRQEEQARQSGAGTGSAASGSAGAGGSVAATSSSGIVTGTPPADRRPTGQGSGVNTQPAPIRTITRPWRWESVNARSEAEARASVEARIREKWECLALAGQTTRLFVDPSSISCRQYGIQDKRWSCSASGTCEISGPGLGEPSKGGGASAQ